MRRVLKVSTWIAICMILLITPFFIKARLKASTLEPNEPKSKFEVSTNLVKSQEKPTVRIPVLMYHDFVDNLNSHSNVKPIDFEKQLKYLKDCGYQTISDRDLTLYFEGKKNLPSKPIMITIDDGYQSNYDSAFPILKKLGMKATIFVIVNDVGKKPGFSRHFDWKQAKEMYDSGLVDIENHTFNLHYEIPHTSRRFLFFKKTTMVPVLTNKITVDGETETEAQYEKRVHDDLLLAKNLIEKHVGNHVDAIAYPYGVTNKTVMKIAAQIGMRYGFVIKNGISDIYDHDMQIDRISVSDNDTGASIVNKISQALAARPMRGTLPLPQ
ncbi:polysaccharide deacetylase family protein [Paenibacillus sediminis]|uniref:Peptidoglycan/xylan/chitin deacetylase (PgdA/CDA1 family) n=1 Tax=Paenibacillus sediminis TaxID=664909 RepID=A0ABS4H0R4_9BACL|nr:polysaccharide deacetylase family protein [Paenibacillus sediminis]MBP1936114.1 peptidoglycan/xylan/chitin deacetylase (PgdA/CDA1 family) [Paenibacillus sediminis]